MKKKCTTVIQHAERYQIQLKFVRRQENLHQWEAPDGAPFHVVGPRSPEPWRQEVERLAYNFKREMHFDFPPYTANESDSDRKPCHDRVLAFSRDIIMTEYIYFIGAIGFRLDECPGQPPRWCATWAWLHPYERGRGHLANAWPFLLEMFPAPHFERPLSQAMEQFLRKYHFPTLLDYGI